MLKALTLQLQLYIATHEHLYVQTYTQQAIKTSPFYTCPTVRCQFS